MSFDGEWEESTKLYTLIVSPATTNDPETWSRAIQGASSGALRLVLSQLSNAVAYANVLGARSAITAELDTRNTRLLSEQTERLERGMGRLTIVGIAVSIVGVGVAIVQLVKG